MSAYVRFAAASALAVSFAVQALPAAAADLYEPPRGGYGYNDGPPPDRYAEPPEDFERNDGPPPDRYAEPPEDFEPPYPPPRYARRDACVPREVIRDRLRAAGWGDFHAVERREQVVLIKARRPSGRLFDLTIDRCSGEVVDARPLYGRRLGPFAYGPRRNWPGPY